MEPEETLLPLQTIEVQGQVLLEPSEFSGSVESHGVGKYIRTGRWFILLLSGYAFNRLCTRLSLPPDAQHHTWFGHARNISDLVLLGFLQGWFVGVLDSNSRWSFLRSRTPFFLLFFGTGPVYSLISSINGIDEAVAENADFSLPFIITIACTAAVIIGFLSWHVRYAFSKMSDSGEAVLYIFARGLLILLLFVAYGLIHSEPNSVGIAKLHLHHYFVAWTISLFAVFNHRLSGVFLAITCGIFVQGISAYGAGSLFYRDVPEKDCPELRIFQGN